MSPRFHNLRLGINRRLKNLAFGHASENFYQDISGLIHVGANYGQEAKAYNKLELDVLWVEAIPEIYDSLQDVIHDFEKQKAVAALVTDVDGQDYHFNISNNNGLSSSIYELKDHKDIWPEVHYINSLKLQSKTLNSVILDNNINPTVYQALILDTQGSELLVLKGCLPLLQHIKYIKTEAADFEAYEGGCQLEELNQFITNQGFVEISRSEMAQHDQGGSYYDIIYKKIAPSYTNEVFDID